MKVLYCLVGGPMDGHTQVPAEVMGHAQFISCSSPELALTVNAFYEYERTNQSGDTIQRVYRYRQSMKVRPFLTSNR